MISIRGRDNPPTLDPAYATRTFDGHLACLVHGGLLRCNPDGEIVPELARSWKTSEGGKKYAFEIQPGLRFPSGNPLDATAVVESWSRICRPETGSSVSWVFEDIVGYDRVISGELRNLPGLLIRSATELEAVLRAPSATFPARMSMPAARIVDPMAIEQAGEDYGRHPKALGAWKLVEWEDDSHLLFRPNPLYPERNDSIKGLRFDLIAKDFSASARFETGNVHILNPLPSSQSDYWKEFPTWRKQIHSVPQLNLYYLGFGCHRKPFDNPKVRLALAKALDSESIRETLYGERAIPAWGPIPPKLVGSEEKIPESSPLSASEEEILQGLTFEMWFPDVDPTSALVMEGFQANLLKHGVRVRLRRVDRTAYSAWRREGRFDAFLGNWWADFPDPDNFITPLFVSDSDSNMTRFKDPQVDNWAEEARGLVNPEERGALYRKIGRLLREQTPMVFLWHLNEEVLTQPWVKGYEPPALYQGTLYLRLGISK
ncbi:MAG: ABC transporter substrate-binding protein [Candidatus Omnitrophica bacterium]|nr:ABC transporter substrate-binding protein [Candidatus Omnitrophota bacterium]